MLPTAFILLLSLERDHLRLQLERNSYHSPYFLSHYHMYCSLPQLRLSPKSWGQEKCCIRSCSKCKPIPIAMGL